MRAPHVVLLALLPALLAPTADAQGLYVAKVDIETPPFVTLVAQGSNVTIKILVHYEVDGGLCERGMGPQGLDRIDLRLYVDAPWLDASGHHRTLYHSTWGCEPATMPVEYDLVARDDAPIGEFLRLRFVAKPTQCGLACQHENETVEATLLLAVAPPPPPPPPEAPTPPAEPSREGAPAEPEANGTRGRGNASVSVDPENGTVEARFDAEHDSGVLLSEVRNVPGPGPVLALLATGLVLLARRRPA